MEHLAKYPIETFDEHNTFWHESNCGNCNYLIDGLCYFTCDKHPDKIPAKFWNNRKTCPDRKQISEHKPYRK